MMEWCFKRGVPPSRVKPNGRIVFESGVATAQLIACPSSGQYTALAIDRGTRTVGEVMCGVVPCNLTPGVTKIGHPRGQKADLFRAYYVAKGRGKYAALPPAYRRLVSLGFGSCGCIVCMRVCVCVPVCVLADRLLYVKLHTVLVVGDVLADRPLYVKLHTVRVVVDVLAGLPLDVKFHMRIASVCNFIAAQGAEVLLDLRHA